MIRCSRCVDWKKDYSSFMNYRLLRIFLILSLFFAPLFITQSYAEEEFDLNELLEGFEDNTPTGNNEESLDELLQGFEESMQQTNRSFEPIEKRSWDLVTLLSLSSSYNYQHEAPATDETDYRGLSRLKVKVQPEFRYKFNRRWDSVIIGNAFYDFAYRVNGRSQYTSETLDTYESELEFRDVYLRGTITENFDIKLGRQIVVWGKADAIRVVDILNPLDFREPGMVDIEDLRLPVTMFKADYYVDDWNLSLITIPEIRFNKLPSYGSDFYVPDSKAPPESVPSDFENYEFAAALEGIFSGWDLSFYFAHYYDDMPHFVLNGSGQPIGQAHSKLNLLGVSTNIAYRDWLIKVESAFIEGLEFASTDITFNRTDLLLGFDYSGFVDTTLTVEAVNRRLWDYDSVLSSSIDQTEGQVAFRYAGSFLHDKVNVVALATILGLDFDAGSYYRGSIEYELMNATYITFGGIIYQSGNHPLAKAIARNDRVFMDFRVSF